MSDEFAPTPFSPEPVDPPPGVADDTEAAPDDAATEAPEGAEPPVGGQKTGPAGEAS